MATYNQIPTQAKTLWTIWQSARITQPRSNHIHQLENILVDIIQSPSNTTIDHTISNLSNKQTELINSIRNPAIGIHTQCEHTHKTNNVRIVINIDHSIN